MLNAVQLASRQDGVSAADISRTFQIPMKTVQSWEKGDKRPPAWVESKITSYVQQLRRDRYNTAKASQRNNGQPGAFGAQRRFAQGGPLQGGFSRPANLPQR